MSKCLVQNLFSKSIEKRKVDNSIKWILNVDFVRKWIRRDSNIHLSVAMIIAVPLIATLKIFLEHSIRYEAVSILLGTGEDTNS